MRKVSITETEEGWVVHATGEPSTGAGFSSCEAAITHFENFSREWWQQDQWGLKMPVQDSTGEYTHYMSVTSVAKDGTPAHACGAPPLRYATRKEALAVLRTIQPEALREECHEDYEIEFKDKQLLEQTPPAPVSEPAASLKLVN